MMTEKEKIYNQLNALRVAIGSHNREFGELRADYTKLISRVEALEKAMEDSWLNGPASRVRKVHDIGTMKRGILLVQVAMDAAKKSGRSISEYSCCKIVAKELGVPVSTVYTWWRRRNGWTNASSKIDANEVMEVISNANPT